MPCPYHRDASAMEGVELFGPRRFIRLPAFRYGQPGSYFLTICAYEKNCIFGRVSDSTVELTALGQIVSECWIAIPQHFPHAETTAHVVMPNHLHGIVIFRTTGHEDADRSEAFQKPVAGSLPTVVRSYKAAVRLEAKRAGVAIQRVWQRGYFERVIRNEKEFWAAVQYITENPARWELDRENPMRSFSAPRL